MRRRGRYGHWIAFGSVLAVSVFAVACHPAPPRAPVPTLLRDLARETATPAGSECAPITAERGRSERRGLRASAECRYAFPISEHVPVELRFTPAAPLGGTAPMRFEVRFVATDGSESVLYEDELEPSQEPAWGDEQRLILPVDEGELVLEAASLGVGEEGVWANPRLVTSASAERLNVVLISVDTLRADHMSLYGYGQVTTPTIDDWSARRGVVFDTVVAPAPWTLPSHISMLTGLDAISHGANYNLPAREDLVLVQQVLSGAGWATAAFTGGGWLGPAHGLDRGFDEFTYWNGQPTRELVNQAPLALDWIAGEPPEPFFLFLHTYEVHEPYVLHERDRAPDEGSRPDTPPAGWQVRARDMERTPGDGFVLSREFVWGDPTTDWQEWPTVPPDQLDQVVRRYDSGVRSVDRYVGQVVDALATAGLQGRTVIILTSDHGEALGEHGLASHAYLYDFNLLVPLVIDAPGWVPARVAQQVRLIDIVPTICDLLGVEAPAGIDGVSLRELAEGSEAAAPRAAWSYAASSNRGVALRTADSWKYMFNNTAWQPVFGSEELYRLTEDPGEEVSLDSDSTARQAQVLERLTANTSGVRLWLVNPGRDSFEVSIRAKFARPLWLKAAGTGVEGARWDGGGAFSVTVPPGTRLLFHSEGPRQGSARVRISTPTEAGFEREVDLESLPPEGWAAVLDGGSWKESTPTEAGEGPRVSLVWRGPGGEAVEVGDEVRERLRALGYAE